MAYFEDYNLSLTQKLDKKGRFAKVSKRSFTQYIEFRLWREKKY